MARSIAGCITSGNKRAARKLTVDALIVRAARARTLTAARRRACFTAQALRLYFTAQFTIILLFGGI
jgi:hypothetical protein